VTVLVDTEGWPIEAAPREKTPALPKLTGIAARDRDKFAREAASALEALEQVRWAAPALLGGLTEVDLSLGNTIVLKRGDGLPQLWLSREDAGRNLANYRRIQSEIERQFKPVQAIDLRWKDQIALRPGKTGGRAE